jgi:hypothetical protein
MKLYNIYTNLILENIKQKIHIFEGVSGNLIDTVLAGDNQRPGKHYRVNIRYRNQKGEVSNQFIEINQKNISSAGNGLIDARVLSKNGEELPDDVYKKFRLDGIEDFKITKVAYYKPGDKMRTDGGNDSKTVRSVSNYADYDFKYSPSTIKQKERKANQLATTQNLPAPAPEPAQKANPITVTPAPAPAPTPQPKPIVRPMKRLPVAKPIVKTKTTNRITNKPEIEPEEIGSEDEEENINVR